MRGFEPMTLANIRLNGIRMVIASCANCGRSADVNVDLLSDTLTVPRPADVSAAAAAAGTRCRPAPLGIGAHGRAFLTIGANGLRCPRPATATARPSACMPSGLGFRPRTAAA
jgi:hypothetical protein